MADETEREERAPGGGGFETGSPAWAALGAASRVQADAFLEEQVRLAREQTELARVQKLNLLEQNAFELSHLRWRRFNDQMKGALQIMLVVVGLLVVITIAVAMWNAARDHDLVVDTFSVPPDLAARGLTGQGVAAELLDKLSAMEARTEPTAQSAGSYHLNAGDTIRIAIPETGGISVGDIDRSLRAWLGHEVHVNGEVLHTAKGFSITVRTGASAGARAEGTDIEALLQKSAENVFAQTEPIRFADYLADSGRFSEAIARLQPLSITGPARDRALALTSWAEALDFDGRAAEALVVAKDAVRLVPTSGSFAYAVISDAENEMGHEQAAHDAEAAAVRYARQSWTSDEATSPAIRTYPLLMSARRDLHEGDYSASLADWKKDAESGGVAIPGIDASLALTETVAALAGAHEGEAAKRIIRVAGPSAPASSAFARAVLAYSADDWHTAEDEGARLQAWPHADAYLRAWTRVVVVPRQAVAMARLGDLPGAEALIGTTPVDCDLCARARGQIAALAHDWSGAAHWFAMVAARSPDIPFADTDWGEMLLAKGDYDGAIAKFQAANKIGPHFADPLEMWGEALIAKHRSDRALAKFEEAAKYAPNWGRLHLKWGEALQWSGDKDAAQKQFATAAHLDLSPTERAQLARMAHV